MKIVLDARFWRTSTGGVGRYSRELVKGLLRLKADDEFHIIITPEDNKEFDLKDKRIKKHIVDIAHYTWQEQLRLGKFIESLRGDLVHFLTFNQPLFMKGKRVTTVHDLTLKYFPIGRQTISPIRKLAFNLVTKRAVCSDAVIAPSRSTKEDIIRDYKIDPEKIHLIAEAASREFKKSSKSELGAFKKAKNLDEYILFVSQLRPHKGVEDLVDAFEILKSQKLFKGKLVIVGKVVPEFTQIEQKIKNSKFIKDILVTGFVPDDDLMNFYSGATVFAFPSWYEGFGLGALEAMQFGLPVVATNNSSLPEVVGDAGVYCNPQDPKSLAAALKKVVQSPKLQQELSKKSIERSKLFSWDKMAEETYKVYKSLL